MFIREVDLILCVCVCVYVRERTELDISILQIKDVGFKSLLFINKRKIQIIKLEKLFFALTVSF